MSSLNNAIQLIREGRKEEARKILELLLRAEPGNIQAWFWYVDVFPTLEKRIPILETCLKTNPGNPQVLQALGTLRNQLPPAASEPPSSYSAVYDKEPNQPIYFDDSAAYPPVTSNPTQGQFTGKKKSAWENDNVDYVDNSMLSKPKPARPSYAFYDVWLGVLSMMGIDTYQNMLDDPEAGAGRAFEWMAYAGIISGLIFPFSLLASPQFDELRNTSEFYRLFGNMGTTALLLMMALIMALLTPIVSVLGLAISAGIQNFLSVMMGGTGYFGRTAYAIAAYLAPMTIISAALGAIPVVGQCLTSLFGVYNILLNMRALQASHSFSAGRAIVVMILPSILIMIFGCLLIYVFSLPGLSR